MECKTVTFKVKLTAVALVNKRARIVFAILTRGETYDDRPAARNGVDVKALNLDGTEGLRRALRPIKMGTTALPWRYDAAARRCDPAG